MDLSLYRCHDYDHLLDRWRAVAQRAGVRMEPYTTADGYDLYRLAPEVMPLEGGVYLSAGIHGDEPAGSEGLIRWAEAHPEALGKCLIFPCLNPWGLVNNSRLNEKGIDLNRLFHLDDIPEIRLWKELIAPYRFEASICLHEDYDGQGLYLYEIEREAPFWGEALLDSVQEMIPLEGRLMIDGREASHPGIVRQKLDISQFPTYPEAIYLHQFHSQRSFTFETPSEFALDLRVRVQVELIRQAVKRALG